MTISSKQGDGTPDPSAPGYASTAPAVIERTFDGSKSVEMQDLPEPEATDVLPRGVRLAALAFAAIAVLIGLDLVDDSGTGADTAHLVVEGIVMLLSVVGVAVLWRGLRLAQARAARLDVDLGRARAEAERFRSEASDALAGLGDAIDRQFARWQLTPAEREVGLLLLKGLSHREAADVRQTSEATARQQALAVYRKSGLRNRAELSAFFLEDLLLPRSG
jgi:DNA-binding CsgD family transcriptional regulator